MQRTLPPAHHCPPSSTPGASPADTTVTPLRQSSSLACRPSTSSLPRSHKRVKSARQSFGGRAKREASIPMLSQQLSTFSLRQDISPEMLTQETTLTSPFKCASHTTSASLTTPYTSTFKHHLSVKHIPQKSKSAGPKFVTQNAKDRHIKDISPTRPASRDHLADWDASHPSSDEPDLEWLQSGEWLPPLQSKENNVQGCLQGSLQHCRDTDCSVSSMEFGGSDTSSVSLLSLSRSSLDHQSRPDIVQWDENPTETDEDQEEHRGLGAQSRSSALHLPVKLHSSPSISPFITSDSHKSPNDSQADFPMNSPSIFNARSSQHARSDSRSTILPRLLLSKKSTATLREQKERSNHMEDDEMMSDVEDIPSPKSPSRSRSFWDRAKFKTSRNPFDGNGLGATFGLGIELGPHRIPPSEGHNENNRLSVSIASDSSEDADLSPSRSLLSNRRSVSTFAHGPPKENVPEVASKREAPIRPTMPRRMATVGSIFRRMPRTSTPVIPTLNSLRGKGRPPMRRGATDPIEKPKSNLLVADAALNTPQALPFADIKPSPSVFASAGLVQKKSRFSGVEIPKFGSEPLADVKRKQSASQYGTQPGDGSMQPPSPISPIQSMSAPSIPLKGAGFAAAVSSNAHFAQQAQKTRGLRKKRSSMFKTGSSISSMDMIRGSSRGSMNGVSLSPVTPTKHDGIAKGCGLTTPSPIRAPVVYPFASSNPIDLDLFSTPPSNRLNRPGTLDAPVAERYRSMLAGSPNATVEAQRRPVIRASNPMLAASFKSAAQITTPARGHVSQDLSMFTGRPKLGGEGITRLETDFALVENLGSGAFSQVWKAREKKTGKVFAVKAGKPYTGVKNRLRQLEEIAILHELSLDPHPNVVQYVDSWESHSRLYILTTLVDCGDLSSFLSLLSDHGGIREARVWKSLVELAEGIDHIHKHHFLHLDIKPSNILIDRAGGLVVADLGMAVICGDGPNGHMLGGMSPALPERDERGGFVWDQVETPMDDGKKSLAMVPSPIMDREVEGDREYLCPEALNESEMIGKGADVYSLGILLLEAALNVVLPSNGDAWVQLRNDDFSDLNGIYIPRSCSASSPSRNPPLDDPNMPVLSDDLLTVIKGLMRSNPDRRWTLADIWRHPVVKRVRASERGKALVEESDEWLKRVLGEELL
ncbi:WEE/WEE-UNCLASSIFIED protein kinase, partial [Cryptococcus bacillisporus CA1873]